MRAMLIRWAVSALAIAAAAWLVPGIEIGEDGVIVVLAMAIVLGLVNAIVRPILTCLTCPFVALTLGLFLFVINALAFSLASWIAQNWLGLDFQVQSFLDALLGSIIVSVVATLLTLFVPDGK